MPRLAVSTHESFYFNGTVFCILHSSLAVSAKCRLPANECPQCLHVHQRNSSGPFFVMAGKEVIGRKLAIWKNRMGEWVNGKLVEFDMASGQHKV